LSSGFGGGGAGEIRYIISVDDSQAIGKLQGVGQQLQTLGQNSATATDQVAGVAPALDQVATSSDKVKESSQTAGPSIASVGTAIAFAASSVISLVQQYTSLKRAQNTLERAQNIERGQVIAITKQREKYNKAVKEYGLNSKEARMELDKLNLLESKHSTQVEKIGLLQESLSQRMLSFAVSVVPTTIGAVSGLAQTFQILGTGRGGAGGMRGVLGLITRFVPPLLILGGFLLAVKFNLFGLRDALDGVGKSIGDAMPTLKPFLNAIRDLGVVIGLVPGNAQEAQKRLKTFAGGVIAWSKDVASAIGKIFDKLKSGDITGAIDDIKKGLKQAFDLTIGQIKVNGFTLTQWVAGLPIVIKHLFDKEGDWEATIDTFKIIIENFIWPNFTEEAEKGLAKAAKDIDSVFKNPAGAGLGNLVLDISNFITMAKQGDTSNEKFENWLSTQIGLFKVTLKQKFIEFKNWVLTQPILGDVIKALFPGQKGSTLGGLDISGAIFTFLDDNVVKPLQQGWATAVNTVYNYLIKNPIIKAITDFIFGKGSSINLSSIGKWFTDNVVSPIQQAWATVVTTVYNYLTQNPIIKKIIDFVFAAGSSLKLPDVAGWFEKNVAKPVRDAWTSLIEGLKSFFSSHTIEGAMSSATGFSGFPGGGFDFGETKRPPSRSKYYTQSFGDLSLGTGPVCFDDSGKQMPCSTKDDNANVGRNSGMLQGKTDFRQLLMGMGGGGGNSMDVFARQIVQITKNLNTFAQVIVQVTKDISVYAKAIVTTVTDHNTFAKTIVTIVKDINTYAKTVVTLTKDISVYAKAIITTVKDHNTFAKTIVTIIKDNNTYAKTIVQVTKNISTYAKAVVTTTKDHNQLAKTIVTVTKDLNQMARAISQNTKNLNTFARALVTAAKDAKSLASAIKSIPTNVNIHVGASGPGLQFAQHGMHETIAKDTLIYAHKGERVDIGPGSTHGGGGATGGGSGTTVINLRISGNDIINERTLSKRIREGVGMDMDKFG